MRLSRGKSGWYHPSTYCHWCQRFVLALRTFTNLVLRKIRSFKINKSKIVSHLPEFYICGVLYSIENYSLDVIWCFTRYQSSIDIETSNWSINLNIRVWNLDCWKYTKNRRKNDEQYRSPEWIYCSFIKYES